MSAGVVRGVLASALAVGAVAGAAPAASAAAVSLKLSSAYAWGGSSVTATVTSDAAGTVSLYQLRSAAKQSGPGRCFLDQGYVGGLAFAFAQPAAKVTVAAGKPATVKLQGGKLAYFGGDLLGSVFKDQGPEACDDPPTQYVRLGAFLGASRYADDGHDVRPLTRVF